MEHRDVQPEPRAYRVRRLRRQIDGGGRRPPGMRFGRVLALCLLAGLLGGLAGAWAVTGPLAAAPVAPAPPVAGAVGVNSPPVAAPVPQATMSVEFNSAISEAAGKAGPAVVGIVNQVRSRGRYEEVGTGSGVVFDQERGLVATNHHVITIDRRLAPFQRLVVKSAAGNFLEAELVGSDPLTDLAVLRVKDGQGELEAQAELGDSSVLKVGDPVLAIGNPGGLEFERTVTAGIISGVNRELAIPTNDGPETTLQVLQTDAAINPGNSGGALVNLAGQVIGINSVKVARQGFEGMGFAIPINFARPILNDLVQHGRVLRPVLGISAYSNRVQQQWQTGYDGPGLVVSNVVRGGPAAGAGIQPGDIILRIADQSINRFGDLPLALGRHQPGDQVPVVIRRYDRQGQAEEITVMVTLAAPEL